MVQNFVKAPCQILRGRTSLMFCFCSKVSCFSDRRNVEEFCSHLMTGKVNTYFPTYKNSSEFLPEIADDHSILNFDKKKAAYFAYKWFDTRDTVFCHQAAQRLAGHTLITLPHFCLFLTNYVPL